MSPLSASRVWSVTASARVWLGMKKIMPKHKQTNFLFVWSTFQLCCHWSSAKPQKLHLSKNWHGTDKQCIL